MRRAVRRLLEKLPPELRSDPDELLQFQLHAAVTIVHLIHRRAAYETHAQDYEFSRLSVEEHWQAGRNDVNRTLRHPNGASGEKPERGACACWTLPAADGGCHHTRPCPRLCSGRDYA